MVTNKYDEEYNEMVIMMMIFMVITRILLVINAKISYKHYDYIDDYQH